MPVVQRMLQLIGILLPDDFQMGNQVGERFAASIPRQLARIRQQHVHIAHAAGCLAHRLDGCDETPRFFPIGGAEYAGNSFNPPRSRAQLVHVFGREIAGQALQRFAKLAQRFAHAFQFVGHLTLASFVAGQVGKRSHAH